MPVLEFVILPQQEHGGYVWIRYSKLAYVSMLTSKAIQWTRLRLGLR